jgi:uncharacterized membrane protein YeaQ/YmgE (transglycosylase-associated protein family)
LSAACRAAKQALSAARETCKNASQQQSAKGGLAMPTIDQVIVWIVIGLIGGSLAGRIIAWESGGFGLLRNLALGLAGALIGGLLFRLFDLLPKFDLIAISLRDVVAAVIGSLILLAGLWLWRHFTKDSAIRSADRSASDR